MAYFNGYQPYSPNPGYPQFPQNDYGRQRMDYLQSMQQQPQPPSDLQARIVTSREEAVAAQVLPNGVPFVFYNPNRQELYLKRIDPQTGAAEFADFARFQPQPPAQAAPVQYAPLERFEALEDRMDRIEGMLTATQSTRKQKGAETE